jgi:hypothetical protein
MSWQIVANPAVCVAPSRRQWLIGCGLGSKGFRGSNISNVDSTRSNVCICIIGDVLHDM